MPIRVCSVGRRLGVYVVRTAIWGNGHKDRVMFSGTEGERYARSVVSRTRRYRWRTKIGVLRVRYLLDDDISLLERNTIDFLGQPVHHLLHTHLNPWMRSSGNIERFWRGVHLAVSVGNSMAPSRWACESRFLSSLYWSNITINSWASYMVWW